jgi:hypothetical protein
MDVPVAAITPLLEGVLQSRVPPYNRERFLGLDGTSYEALFGDASVRSQFRWWESPPEGWEPLQHFVDGVQKLFDETE